MALQSAADVPLLITSPNSSSERRISPSWSIAHLKARLEPITGVPASCQQLSLRVGSQDAVAVAAADEEQTRLAAFPLQPYAEMTLPHFLFPRLSHHHVPGTYSGLLFSSTVMHFATFFFIRPLLPHLLISSPFALALPYSSHASDAEAVGSTRVTGVPRNLILPPPPSLALHWSSLSAQKALAKRRTRGTATPRLTRQHQILPPEHWASLLQAINLGALEHHGSASLPHVVDTRPSAARTDFTDLSSVTKYEMPAAEYEHRSDSVLAWKKAQKLGRFDPDAPSIEQQKIRASEREVEERDIQTSMASTMSSDVSSQIGLPHLKQIDNFV
ncbi:hypothetical protein CFE70_007728 [Pyrenophora teres f. teres 0-1]